MNDFVDLGTAAVRRLQNYLPFRDLVDAGKIGKDPDGTVWLFQGLDDQGRPFRDPEGSGTAVIVLSEYTQWAPMNETNNMYFPGLQMLIYADSTRNEDGSPAKRDAHNKAKQIYRALNPAFHRPGQDELDWHPEVAIHMSLQDGPFYLHEVPMTQSLTVRAEVNYKMITD